VEAQRSFPFFCADHPIETISRPGEAGLVKRQEKKGEPDMVRDPQNPQRISEKYQVREALVADWALLYSLKDGFSRETEDPPIHSQ